MTAQRLPARVSRELSFSDVTAALKAGFGDFLRAPLLGLFFGGIYALGGILIYLLLVRYKMPWLIVPLAVGFPLIGPFVAAGLYEVSRRLARGQSLAWREILLVVFAQSRREMGWMAFTVLFIFWVWMYQVRLMVALFLGFKAFSTIDGFLSALGTPDGLIFLAAGSAVGAVLALVLYCATVIAMPMLLDRDVDFITAIITSFRTVFENPFPMLAYAALVAALTFLALLPMLLGLLVILPLLGHATWHLYERAVEPKAEP
jgi:uncharacterized membrane protein